MDNFRFRICDEIAAHNANGPGVSDNGSADPGHDLRVRPVPQTDFAHYHADSGLIRAELASQMAEPIELFDATLDSVRFADSQHEGALVEYLRAEAGIGSHLVWRNEGGVLVWRSE